MTRQCQQYRGFTLIEVLVVVSVIALLVAILLPSLKQARWQARLVGCQGRLHDLGSAFQMYANVYSGYFPLTRGASDDNFAALWRARLLPNPDVLICPATQNVVRPETVPYAKNPDTEEMSDLYFVADGPEDATGGHSYEYNGCYNGDSGFSLSRANKRASTFVFPPHDMLLVHDADEARQAGGYPEWYGCRPGVVSDSGNNCPQPWDNHGKTGMNMMFADGHARWTRKTSGSVVDMRKATQISSPDPKPSVNADIETIWLKSQYPWRYRMR